MYKTLVFTHQFGLNISSQVQRQHPEGADPGPVEADTEARNAAEDEAEEAVDTSSKQFIKYSQLIKAMKVKPMPVLPKQTLFKVLYFILAKCKNYTLLLYFFQSDTLKILYYRIKLYKRIKSSLLILFS